MSVVIVLILVSLVVGLIFVGAFVWAVRGGQYDDTLTPAMRVLLDDATVQKNLTQAGGQAAPCPASDKNLGAAKPKN